ncbi:MAG: hypothetical protein HY049_20085 [Acidobacteria bacterium]|nr:hypothetical protein [Acidobacteriota bacterium]
MAESVVVGLRSTVSCGFCGKPIHADLAVPAHFCRDCGCCLLVRTPAGSAAPLLTPLVPPRVTREAAWSRLQGTGGDLDRAQLTGARLLLVPFHEWAPDLGRTRVVKDARALLAPACDLLPAGFQAPVAPLGDDRRGLSIAETAHRGRLADPAAALALIREGEAVDVMVPAPDRIPEGAATGSSPRLLHYPLWFLTYRIDWTERRGVVDAVTGEPVGPSSTPRMWSPAALAAAAGGAAFVAAFVALRPLAMPWIQAAVAAAFSCGAATWTWGLTLRRERGR